MSIYDIKVNDFKHEEVDLSEYRGKVLLIVNTATECGFTPQYEGLENLYKKYKDDGLEILDFPCDQFGNQAPGSDDEIHEFCSGRFGVTFRQFEKVLVNGDQASDLFKFLKKEKSGTLTSDIKWNFTKFLVDRDGRVVKRFSSLTKPEKIEEDIKAIL